VTKIALPILVRKKQYETVSEQLKREATAHESPAYKRSRYTQKAVNDMKVSDISLQNKR